MGRSMKSIGGEYNGTMTAMLRLSAGLLMYRIKHGVLQVLLAHPGGRYFRSKHDEAGTIPDEDLSPRPRARQMRGSCQ